jgi:hypothetical protein
VAAVYPTRRAGAALVALAAVIAAAVVAAALLTPRPWAVRAGAPGDAYFLVNSFPPERGGEPLRWTRDLVGLRLFGAYAGPVALDLRLYRDPEGTAGQPWPLEVRAGDAALARFEALPGWRRYSVVLPPGASAAPLALASPTFQPGGGDARNLGVAISELRAAPLAGAPPLGYALGRAAWLAALLALAASAAWLIDAWSLGAAGARGRPLRAAALTGGLGAAAALWAWLGPASFAWALPWGWRAAGVAGVAVAAGAALVALAGRPRDGAQPASPLPEGVGREPRRRVGISGRRRAALVGAGALVLAGAAMLLPLPALWRQVAAVAFLLGPGALAALALLWGESDGAELAFLGAAGGLAVAALLVLGLHALPGPLPWWALAGAAGALSAAGLWALWSGADEGRRPAPARAHRWLALPLLIGVAVRLWGLGVSQFQGDEAYALLLARGVVHGQDEILLVHLKGPVEALLPAGPLALTGTVAEASARLPFALAGIALVVAAWALAGRLFGGRAGDVAGFVAALAVSADGLLTAFGRIVQYQTVVLLLSAAALWLCWRFFEGMPARRALPAAALCVAVAVLAHYDGIYVTPALAWLVVAGGLRRGWRPRQWAIGLAPAVAVGLALTLSFYVPFVRHEHFASTVSHLETRSGQGAGVTLYNNLPGYAALLSTYATRYVAAFAGLALLGLLVALLVAYLRPRLLGAALAVPLAVGGLAGLLAPGLLATGPDGSLAALLVAPPLLALAVAPRLPAGLRAPVLWLAPALTAHAFLIADPRTHFYTAHLAAWLLIGWGAARLWELGAAPRLRALRPALAGAGAAVLTLGLAYAGMVFLRPWPEFERAYPATMLPFFAPPTGEALPDDGLFAFPARDGWKTAAALFEQGVLRGSVDSNAEKFTPGWYLRGQFRCQSDPDYFLTATGATPLYIPPGYSPAGAVTVDGVRALEIYSRAPVDGLPRLYDAADYEAAYDAAPVPNFPLRRLLSGVVPQVRQETPWRDGFALRGFDLDRATAAPGQDAFLTLYWRASAAQPASLAPAVQIRDARGRAVAEAAPYCGGMPADAWHTTYVNDTPFRVSAAGLAPGVYTLHAGVRDRSTGAWMPLAGGGDLVELAEIVVEE